MINNEWERSLDELNRTIQDAIDNQNYGRLNQNVTDTIGRAMDGISRGLKNGIRYGGSAMNAAADSFAQRQNYTSGGFAKRQSQTGGSGGYTSGQGAAQGRTAGANDSFGQNQRKDGGTAYSRGATGGYGYDQRQPLYLKGTAVKVGGVFLAITGYLSMVVVQGLMLLILFGNYFIGWNLAVNVGAAILGVFELLFGVMGIVGTVNACTVTRFRKYVKLLGDREYCDVKELAQKSGRSAKAVVKDLRKMIKKGWFRQGHLDEQGTCLMTSNDAYHQYMELMERTRQENEEKAVKAAKAEKEKAEFSKLSPEVQKIIEAGDEYVRKIREANDAIPGEEISEKIDRMEMLVDRIFDRVEQKPDTVGDIRKLMDYYLPMTMKLLDAYEDLDGQPVQGENIISAKVEIEKTIDTLNVAFEKLLDDLFQETAWDVSSDISVLNTMLAQEGLTEDGLKKKK